MIIQWDIGDMEHIDAELTPLWSTQRQLKRLETELKSDYSEKRRRSGMWRKRAHFNMGCHSKPCPGHVLCKKPEHRN